MAAALRLERRPVPLCVQRYKGPIDEVSKTVGIGARTPVEAHLHGLALVPELRKRVRELLALLGNVRFELGKRFALLRNVERRHAGAWRTQIAFLA